MERHHSGSAAIPYLDRDTAAALAGLLPGRPVLLSGARCQIPLPRDDFDGYLGRLSRSRRGIVRKDLRSFDGGCVVDTGRLDAELIDTLYRQIYLDRLTGTDRLRIQTMADVVDAPVRRCRGRADRRLALPAPEATTATCYLQGVNESTHGISDSLLSVVAVRAGEIVNDLLGQLARWDRRAGASWQEVTST